jgi:RNA polymerase sigma factor (sigma-70 family)
LATLVHVVDDDASFRTAISRLLRASGYEVQAYESAHELLTRLPREELPSCILLDVEIPGLSGPELQARLAEIGSTLPIVFLTGHGDIPTSVRAIKAGAEDFLTKPVSRQKLLDAIERAMAKYRITRDREDRLKVLGSLLARLTPRERQVLDLVVRGRMNKQIAFELGMTERTVKAHRHNIMMKMQVRTLAELVSMAERLGIASASAL